MMTQSGTPRSYSSLWRDALIGFLMGAILFLTGAFKLPWPQMLLIACGIGLVVGLAELAIRRLIPKSR